MKSSRILIPSLVMMLAAYASPVAAKTYLYNATCKESYSKQGEQDEDLTKQKGKPIKCDSVVLSLLENGHILIQMAEKTSHLTPIGFSGGGLDYDINPNLATVPLTSIYLPHASNAEKAEAVQGIEGYCFLQGQINIRALNSLSCVAKMEIGTQRLVYHINANINGAGNEVPGQ